MDRRVNAIMMPIPYEEAYAALADGEDETEPDLVKTSLEISDTTYADSSQRLPCAQGMFSVPKTCPVAGRMSTSPADVLDDRV